MPRAEISDVLYEAMLGSIKRIVRIRCDEIEGDPRYRIYKIYGRDELEGFCVCHDEDDFTVLDECHYLGQNKYAALRMWKFMTKGKNKLRIICQKVNVKMADFYKRIGFKIVGEDSLNYKFERVIYV